MVGWRDFSGKAVVRDASNCLLRAVLALCAVCGVAQAQQRTPLQAACDAFLSSTAAGQTCTDTELALFARNQDGSCLSCVAAEGCLDPSLAATCDSDAVLGGPSACVNTLRCDLGVQDDNLPPTLVTAPRVYGASFAFCGNAGRECTSFADGPCAGTITHGFPATFTNVDIVAHYLDDRYSSGLGNAIAQCTIFCVSQCFGVTATGTISAPSVANPPVITAGDAAISSFTPPNAVREPVGYELTGMSTTLTAHSLAPIALHWDSAQAFTLTSNGRWGVNLVGHTTLTISGDGRASYTIAGGIDGQTLTQFPQTPVMLFGQTPLVWNTGPQSTLDLSAGTHQQTMSGTLLYYPAAVGDTITTDSAYQIVPAQALSATPVPGAPRWTWLPLAGLLSVFGAWLRRSTRAPRPNVA